MWKRRVQNFVVDVRQRFHEKMMHGDIHTSPSAFSPSERNRIFFLPLDGERRRSESQSDTLMIQMTAFEDHKSYQNKTLNYYIFGRTVGIGSILFRVLRRHSRVYRTRKLSTTAVRILEWMFEQTPASTSSLSGCKSGLLVASCYFDYVRSIFGRNE